MPEPDIKRSVDAESDQRSEYRFAADLRGFGPLGVLAVLVVIASSILFGMTLASIFVLLWVILSRTPWTDIGYVRSRSRTATLVGGIILGIALKLMMKAIVMPVVGAPPINPHYHYLAGNTAMLPAAALTMVAAGFGEETFARGYLFERLGKVLGGGVGARIVIVVLTSALFASGHYFDQGVAGVEQASVTGLVFGTIFARTNRLFMLMIAHATFDLTALAIIYWNIENKVAHLLFN